MGNTITTIFVCSPYQATSKDPAVARSQLEANIERAKMACRMLVKLGYHPLAPHLYFTQFLEDRDAGEREEGIQLGMKWLAQADELWAFGDEITERMSKEIAAAKGMGIPVRMVPEPSQLITDLLAAIKNDEPKVNMDQALSTAKILASNTQSLGNAISGLDSDLNISGLTKLGNAISKVGSIMQNVLAIAEKLSFIGKTIGKLSGSMQNLDSPIGDSDSGMLQKLSSLGTNIVKLCSGGLNGMIFSLVSAFGSGGFGSVLAGVVSKLGTVSGFLGTHRIALNVLRRVSQYDCCKRGRSTGNSSCGSCRPRGRCRRRCYWIALQEQEF